MRIAVDAMGGDFAPHSVVTGALQAIPDISGLEKLFLVGREDEVRACLPDSGLPELVEITPASEVVEMCDPPVAAVRRKRDSSINRAVDLVKEGKADAVFSAGNTGAAVAATTLKLRSLSCVDRPAIASIMPSLEGPFVLIDAGANPDCTPRMLVQFAAMGAVYAREILQAPNPRVGLLSIGGEATKGNDVTREAYRQLQASPLNFQGNIEGHGLYNGSVDVVVCDGFAGNIVLKTSENVAWFFGQWLKQEFTRNWRHKLGALLLKPGLNAIRRKADPATYGGAPLLGVNGICIIGHGGSSAQAIRSAVRVSGEAIRHQLHNRIENAVKELGFS